MGITVGVLGGMGLMAEAALHDLGSNRRVSKVVVADLRLDRRRQVETHLPGRSKFRFVAIDLSQTAAAARSLKGCDVLINASWYELNLKAMDLAVAVGAHYVDLGGLFHMTRRQLRRSAEFEKAGLLAALGCGSTPGITNIMVAAMAEDFDAIDTVGIYDASHDPAYGQSGFLPPFSIRTMLDEYVMPAPILENGRLVEVPAHSRAETLEFRAPIGRCTAGAVIHSEAATLPEFLKRKGVRNLSFKIVYPELVKSQLGLLVSMGFANGGAVQVNGASISPRSFVTAMALSGAAGPVGVPRDFEIARVRISGRRGGRPFAREWDCEMKATKALSAGAMGVGYTAAIVAQMLAEGCTLRSAGVFGPESVLPHSDFFQELTARKVFRLIEREEGPLKEFSSKVAGGRP